MTDSQSIEQVCPEVCTSDQVSEQRLSQRRPFGKREVDLEGASDQAPTSKRD